MISIWSEEDMSCSFYIFGLPDSWLCWTALNVELRGKEVSDLCSTRLKLRADEKVYVGARVLPMGWKSAVGVLQYFHRRLCLLPPPRGAGLKPGDELRKDRPMPSSSSGSKDSERGFWSVYVDNFTQVELTYLDETSGRKGATEEQKNLRAAYDYWGVPRAEDKAVERQVGSMRLRSRNL